MTETMQLLENEDMEENLPFSVVRKNDHIIITAKPSKVLSKQGMVDFNKNCATIVMDVFDVEAINRLNSLPVFEFTSATRVADLLQFLNRDRKGKDIYKLV